MRFLTTRGASLTPGDNLLGKSGLPVLEAVMIAFLDIFRERQCALWTEVVKEVVEQRRNQM